jgi:hypothetical protein
MPDDFRPGDPRTMRLWDLGEDQAVFIRCRCGRVGQYGPGALQRLHRLPSDTLVYDLRFRFRCRKCNSRDSFEVTVEELGTRR